MLVCVLSNRTSPGATSLAVGLGMVWADQGKAPILAECDPAGGVIGLRFGMAERPSLATFASDTRRGATESSVAANIQTLHGMQCLLGPADPRVARRATQAAAPNVAQLHRSSVEPWICDLGRVGEDSAVLELARSADLVLVATRTSVAEVQALVYGVGLLRAQGCELGLVCIGEKPNPPREVAELTDMPLYCVLPEDAGMAAALAGGQFNQRQLRKSSLWRSIVHLAGEVETKIGHLPQTTPGDGPMNQAEDPTDLTSPPTSPSTSPPLGASPAPSPTAAGSAHHTPPPSIATPSAPQAAAPSQPAAPDPAGPAQPAAEYGEVQVWTAANASEQPAAQPLAGHPAPPAPQTDRSADPFGAPTQQNQPTRPRFDDEDDITIPRRTDVSHRE